MSELVEKVAEQIYVMEPYTTMLTERVVTWEQLAPDQKAGFRQKARAAIEAVRLHLKQHDPHPYFWPDGANETLSKIDAILSGAKP